MKKKILITGAGGFVGPYLIKELQKNQDNDIYGLVYSASSDLNNLLPSDHIIPGDLTDPSFANQTTQSVGPDYIYHLAALSVVHNSVDQALRVMQANTAISYNVFESARLNAPHARVLAVCSANVYGAVEQSNLPIKETAPFRPLNPYAVSKITQEMLALEYHLANQLDVVIVRPFNHTGPGQTTDFVIPALASQFVQIMRGQKEPVIEIGNTKTLRDFTDVRDIARAYVLSAERGVAGEVYNIGSGQVVTVKQIIELMEEITQVKVSIKEATSKVRASDVLVLQSDSSKFSALTSWEPSISLKTTLSDILEYERKKSQ